jgi:RNA 3'-terminal phosphate cyclase (ATP)
VEGIAFSSHLAARHVSERMAQACAERLAAAGLTCAIETMSDEEAVLPGASVAVWATTSRACLLGADRAGAPRRSSESIGGFVAEALLADLGSGASVDRHLADQLVPFAALAAGRSAWLAPQRTDHLTTNLWLAERFGARVRLDARRVEVEGIGARSHQAGS